MAPEVAKRLRLAAAAAVEAPVLQYPMFEAAPQAPMIPAKEDELDTLAGIVKKIESWPTNFVRSWIAITKLCNMC